ncbi:MAG: HAD family hydrolase [Clostridia bacterium]|nr:HAD family hydrolase [Clostridia bacterium]
MGKVFIFDFDGTLYSGEHIFDNIHAFISKYKRSFLPNVNDQQYAKIVKENPSWEDAYSGEQISNHIYMFIKKYPTYDISIKAYRKWELNVIEPVLIDKNQTVDPVFLKKLCQEYPVYIVSNSDIIHVKHYMKDLNIEASWFKDIISNQFLAKDPTKKHYFKDILSKEDCKPYDAYVFGDSLSSDIAPAKKLGLNAYHITDARQLPNIIKNIVNLY